MGRGGYGVVVFGAGWSGFLARIRIVDWNR